MSSITKNEALLTCQPYLKEFSDNREFSQFAEVVEGLEGTNYDEPAQKISDNNQQLSQPISIIQPCSVEMSGLSQEEKHHHRRSNEKSRNGTYESSTS